MVEVNYSLYFIGGVGNDQMWSFGLRFDAWKCLAPEQDERIRPLSVGVGHEVFVFGGYTDRHKEVRYFDTAAKFDTNSLKWHLLSPMTHGFVENQCIVSIFAVSHLEKEFDEFIFFHKKKARIDMNIL